MANRVSVSRREAELIQSNLGQSNNSFADRSVETIIALHEQNEALLAALKWYQEIASSTHRYASSKPPNTDAMMAVVTELSLDGGNRARAAIAQAESQGGA